MNKTSKIIIAILVLIIAFMLFSGDSKEKKAEQEITRKYLACLDVCRTLPVKTTNAIGEYISPLNDTLAKQNCEASCREKYGKVKLPI